MPHMYLTMKANGISCDPLCTEETAISNSAYLLLDRDIVR